MENNLTIIHFVHTLFGGVASVAANLINDQQSYGYKCLVVYCVDDAAFESMLKKPCEKIKTFSGRFPGAFMLFGMNIRDIYRNYCIEHPDEKVICHIHNVQALGSLGRWQQIPLVCTLHSQNDIKNTMRERFSNSLYKLALKRLFKYKKPVTSVSKAIVDCYVDAKDKEKVAIVYNGAEIDALKRKTHESFIIGHVGNLSEAKGWDTLFNAYCRLPSNIKKKTFLYAAGNETDKYSYEKMRKVICKNGLVNNVKCLGFINNAKENFIPNIDLLVLASRNEGLGLVQIEAMGYGIPVLGRNVGGICEVLSDGYNGFVIKDEIDLAMRIEQICSDKGLYLKLSQNAYKTYKERFTMEKMCIEYRLSLIHI